MDAAKLWSRHRRLIVELFALINLAFLALDIYIAHSMNAFRHWAEWIPFYFSFGAPVLLLIGIGSIDRPPGKWIGYSIGWGSIGVGITGLIYHLGSSFFEQQTIRRLVYSAPFVAPIAYTGIGFLLLLNRMVDAERPEFGKWLILLALGGFIGNFILALADHAQNGFFETIEWIPVFSAAIASGFLVIAFSFKNTRGFLTASIVVMVVQVMVGVLGFYFHGVAVLNGPAPDLFDNVVYVAPVLAPLLFANIALLAVFGLWDVREKYEA